MKILIIADLKNKDVASVGGVDYWRTVIPATRLAIDHGHKITIVNELPQENQWDVLITNRTLSKYGRDAEEFERLKTWGIPLVVDIDDYWELPPDHILYQHWIEGKMSERVLGCLNEADLIWASTHVLGKKVAQIENKAAKTYIIPNATDPSQPQFANPGNRIPGNNRLGWVGSITHTHDFPVMKEGFKKLVLSGLPYTMNLYGYVPGNEANIKAFMTYKLACGVNNVQFWDAKPVAEYANSYRQIDIVLAPLSKNEFNSCKSELKLIEAANFGLPVVASNCLPYFQNHFKDAVLWATDGEGWFNPIKHLLGSSKARKHYGNLLQRVVSEHYDIRRITELRHKSLCELTGLK